MKADLHVHTRGSQNIVANKWARMVQARESYSQPEEVYKTAKDNGMDLVTITDHNEIGFAQKLAKKYNDMIIGAEYLVKASDQGHLVEIIALGLDDALHKEFTKLRKQGIEEFTNFARKEKIPHFLCHIGYPVNPDLKLTPELLDEWVQHFDVIEILNGTMQRENELAQIIAHINNKSGVGGSDAHTLIGLGQTWTEVETAKNKEEFLKEVYKGNVKACGDAGHIKKLKKIANSTAKSYLKEELSKVKEKGMLKTITKSSKNEWKKYTAMGFVLPTFPSLSGIELRYYQARQERLMIKVEKEYIKYKLTKINKGKPIFFGRRKKKNYLQRLKESYEKFRKPTSHYIPELSKKEKLINKILGYELTINEDELEGEKLFENDKK